MCRHHHKKTSIQLVNVKKFVQMLYYEAKRIFMEDKEKTCSPMMGGMSFFVMDCRSVCSTDLHYVLLLKDETITGMRNKDKIPPLKDNVA